MKTNQNVVIILKDSHNMKATLPSVKRKKLFNQIKQKSESLTTTVAIASETSVISDDYAIQLSLPKKENLIRTACRKRQRENRIDAPTPIDRHFDIPEEFKTFLQKDSGKDDSKRILMFGVTTMNNLLNFSKTWLIDGTFKLSPANFFQIYTIHIELKSFAPPCVCLLLANKTEKLFPNA